MRKFSWKTATGITRAKRGIAKVTGIPTSKTGRKRKVKNIIMGGSRRGGRTSSPKNEDDYDDDGEGLGPNGMVILWLIIIIITIIIAVFI